MAPIEFKDAEAARHFCRMVAAPGELRGSGFNTPDQWRDRANRYAAQIARRPADRWGQTGVQRVATIVKSFRRGRGVRFDAVPCCKCGTMLTNPESVAAGIGPECMAK